MLSMLGLFVLASKRKQRSELLDMYWWDHFQRIGFTNECKLGASHLTFEKVGGEGGGRGLFWNKKSYKRICTRKKILHVTIVGKKLQARSEIRNEECYTEEKNIMREHVVRKIFLVHERVCNKNNHAYTKWLTPPPPRPTSNVTRCPCCPSFTSSV